MAKRKKNTNPPADILKGILRMHPRGFGFVQLEDKTLYQQDIFIPKHLTQNGVEGDIVEVKVKAGPQSDKGPEGEIVAILERGKTHIAGVVRSVEWKGETLAYVPMLGMDQRVVIQKSDEFQLQLGDRVILEVIDWGSKDTETKCKVTHKIGHISNPSTDVPSAIEEYEIRSDFPNEAVKEAKKYGKSIPAKEIKNREDFRELECITIDPDTAKDFDDALSLKKDSKGQYHLGVHIADVSFYVQPGTALDKEASLRSNSTYFPGTCVPMLPPELSENLCSLKPKVNRLAVSVMVTFTKDGSVLNYRIVRSVIRSQKRFTYKDALKVIEGRAKSKHSKTLNLMVELCHLLKKKRYERGSIEFSIPELVIKVDEKGAPYGTELVQYDITHQLVEEYMLKANEIVAEHLGKQGKGVSYRIHEEPSADNMKEFSQIANAFGYNLTETPDTFELQKFFDEAMQTSFGQHLAISYIRKMRLAQYSPNNIGHYGLGLEHYCHFTSPIRRYVDLIIHRSLFSEGLSPEKLEAISKNCSDVERVSEKAENHVVLLKKLRLLDQIQKADPQKQYEAIVTRVRHFGVYFEVKEVMIEGFLHISNLEDDYFIFNDKTRKLEGSDTNISYFSGDKITVMLKEVDLIYLESSWSIVGEKVGKRKRKGKRKGKRRR